MHEILDNIEQYRSRPIQVLKAKNAGEFTEDRSDSSASNFGTPRPADIGYGYNFTGNSYIQSRSNHTLNTQNFEISCYFSREDVSERLQLLALSGGGANSGFELFVRPETDPTPRVELTYANSGSTETIGFLTIPTNVTNETYHIIVRKIGNKLTWYLNSLFSNEQTTNRLIQYANDIFYIGQGTNYNAYVFDIQFKKLSDTGQYIKHELWLKCDETFGSIAIDSSGSKRHCKILNAITAKHTDNPNSIHQTQVLISYHNEHGYNASVKIVQWNKNILMTGSVNNKTINLYLDDITETRISQFVILSADTTEHLSDGRTSGLITDDGDDTYVLKVGGTYGQGTLPNIDSGNFSVDFATNRQSLTFNIADVTFNNELIAFANNKGIANIIPRTLDNWYTSASTTDRAEMDALFAKVTDIVWSDLFTQVTLKDTDSQWRIIKQVTETNVANNRTTATISFTGGDLNDYASAFPIGTARLRYANYWSVTESGIIDTSIESHSYLKIYDLFIRSDTGARIPRDENNKLFDAYDEPLTYKGECQYNAKITKNPAFSLTSNAYVLFNEGNRLVDLDSTVSTFNLQFRYEPTVTIGGTGSITYLFDTGYYQETGLLVYVDETTKIQFFLRTTAGSFQIPHSTDLTEAKSYKINVRYTGTSFDLFVDDRLVGCIVATGTCTMPWFILNSARRVSSTDIARSGQLPVLLYDIHFIANDTKLLHVTFGEPIAEIATHMYWNKIANKNHGKPFDLAANNQGEQIALADLWDNGFSYTKPNVNRLPFSGDMANEFVPASVVIASGLYDPFETNTAVRIQLVSQIYGHQLATPYPDSTSPRGYYTISCYVKSALTVDQKFRLSIIGSQFSDEFTATQEWQRFRFYANHNTDMYQINGISSPDGGSCDILIAGMQIELGDQLSNFEQTGLLNDIEQFIPKLDNVDTDILGHKLSHPAGVWHTVLPINIRQQLAPKLIQADKNDRFWFLNDETANDISAYELAIAALNNDNLFIG